MRARSIVVAVTALLVGMVVVPAHATHDPVQTLPVQGGASEAYVGLADDGVATAVWDDNGAVKVSTRPADGFFGAPQTLAPAYASVISFDEAPNGNAVVAYTGAMDEGELIAHFRSGSSGDFGPAQVLVPDGGGAVFQVDVAASSEGPAAIVWQDVTDPLDPSIMGATSDAAGIFGPAGIVTKAPNVQNPTVDVDAAGNALALWDFTSAQATNEIQKAAAPAGGTFGSVSTLEFLEQGPAEPHVAVNANGAAVVVWADFTSPEQCPQTVSCSRDVMEVAYGNVGGTFGPSQMITDPATPTATGDHEAAIDDSGIAAVMFSATMEASTGLFAAVSDTAGSFSSGLTTLSPFSGVTGGLEARNFEISAGAGNFTAVWGNDHDQDGAVNEAWQSTTTGGSAFDAPHQLSPDDDDSVDWVHGDRNSSGVTVAGWILFVDRLAPQVTPVATGTPPTFGSDSDDDLTGTDGDDVVHLLGGNDIYSGGDGNDSIYGEAGNDNLRGDGGSDLVDGGPGSDTAIGGGGDDSLLGRGGGDKLKGGTGDDTLKGGGGNDVLDGGGASALRASGAAAGGGELIIGGAGKDTCFKYSKKDVLKSCEIVKKRAH